MCRRTLTIGQGMLKGQWSKHKGHSKVEIFGECRPSAMYFSTKDNASTHNNELYLYLYMSTCCPSSPPPSPPASTSKLYSASSLTSQFSPSSPSPDSIASWAGGCRQRSRRIWQALDYGYESTNIQQELQLLGCCHRKQSLPTLLKRGRRSTT
jgi:hypothetical protein